MVLCELQTCDKEGKVMNTETQQPTAKQLLLNRYLSDIFDLGDRDEMSWKHIGHGCASLLAFDDWRKCLDYRRPNHPLTPEQYQKLDALWFMVQDTMNKNGKQWFIDTLELLSEYNGKLMYAAEYLKLNWLDYKKLITAQNLTIKEG